jgi:hypothetical protein
LHLFEREQLGVTLLFEEPHDEIAWTGSVLPKSAS